MVTMVCAGTTTLWPPTTSVPPDVATPGKSTTADSSWPVLERGSARAIQAKRGEARQREGKGRDRKRIAGQMDRTAKVRSTTAQMHGRDRYRLRRE